MGSIEEPPAASLDYDVLIVGAGLSGIFSLYRMRQLGLRARVLEAGSGEGGTWYWNRYPGCRFDSESITYGFSFSQELLDEWSWTETYAPGHETRRYAEYVTDKFDLRKDMQFDTKVKAAHYQQDSRSWLLTDTTGKTYSSRWLITAVGLLSEPTCPNIPGVSDFKGEAFHSSRWPNEGEYSLKGKRCGVIGTGATGIQIIQSIVKPEYDIKSLTVFQRTPNWSAPLRNEPITPEQMNQIRQKYPEIFEACSQTAAGFIYAMDQRKTIEVPEKERLAFWEDLYNRPGLAKWLANFADINFDRQANELFSAFIADKIRGRVHDPKTADKLVPKNHGFGTRRVPLETNYFEAYNDPRVRLVDVKDEAPIERITENGVQLSTGEHIDLDVLIYATGFDAVTGALTAIDIRGIDGVKIGDVWSGEPRTFLGLFVRQFPNMMTIMGPHQAFGNIPRSIEAAVSWVADLIQFSRENNITYVEATEDKVDEWTRHVKDCAKGFLSNEVESGMTGVNHNVKGKHKPIIVKYSGPAPGYRKRCQEVKERRYADLLLK